MIKETNFDYSDDGTYGLIVGTEKITAEYMSRFKNLKVVSRIGSGIDNIDADYCKQHGIAIENTPDAPRQAVAEYVVFQMLNYVRNFNGSTWENKKIGKELKDQKIGILGNGNIGSMVYNLLSGFGCEISVHDVIPDLSDCSVEWLFANCDIITIHIDLCKPNYHFVDKKLLSLMKPTACLINTSRGDIINESHLYEMLCNFPAMTAILDVFSVEPYDGPLKTLKNTVMTPHIASYTDTARRNMEDQAWKNCQKYYTNNL